MNQVPRQNSPRLEVSNLSCVFDGTEVVRGISLSVAAGQVMCLLGPSGCGKSTTLRVIAGVERQTGGTVALDGVTVSDAGLHLPPEARSVGLIFQDFALFPHLNVAQNIAFGLKGRGPEVGARVEDLLASRDVACRVVDVDADLAARESYGLRVPVLAADGAVLLEGQIEEQELLAVLKSLR